MPEADDDLALLIRAARQAGQIALRFWKRNPKTWDKGDEGPVTEADHAVNDALHAILRSARPSYGWLSEETPDDPARLQTDAQFILDPIDGTRGLMYDKRSAWSLAGLAPQRGARTTLADIVVAAMTELPTTKAACSDQLSAIRGGGVRAERLDLRTRRRRALALRPSRARNVAHGFASFAKFFPEGKAWLAAREEELWRRLGIAGAQGGQPVFDDQYLSTGGQLHELVTGRDRFVADLRPLAFAALGLADGVALACHPYDICVALIAQEAGCVVTTPDGRPLRPPLDTTSPVAWVGYANRALARRIGPALRRVLAK